MTASRLRHLLGGLVLLLPLGVLAQAADSTSQPQVPQALQDLVEALVEAEDSEEAESGSLALEIDGLIVDETRTRAGRDFYEAFFANWVPPQGARDFNITIRERPGMARTTSIEVSLNELTVFQANLQPRYDIIVALAEAALARTYRTLLNYEEIQQQLGGDDMEGSGIF